MIHAFRFKDLYLVLDVESGALHALDKQAYDIVKALEKEESPYELPYEKSDIDEVLCELDALSKMNAFNCEEPQLESDDPHERLIKAMCLHIAHDCNLRCRYCFASTGEFHGKRMLMSADVGRRALDFLIKRSGRRRNLEVDLFGGEPLMNFDVVKEIVRYGRALEKKHDKCIRFTMTTNAVALDDEKIRYLNDQMHNIVISLDGRRKVHDHMRPAVNGKGSYDIILPKAKKLVDARGDREYYVRGTFTNRNLDFTKDVESICNEGFCQISLEPVVLPEDDAYAIREEHMIRALEEYDRLSDFILARRREGKWFNFFHFMLDLENGPCLKKRVLGCGAGVEYVAITPEGDIYPCHQFVGEKAFRMGDIFTGELDEGIQNAFLGCNIRTKQQCRACWAKYLCSGGCAANAYKYNGSISNPYAITCAFEKKRAECALGIYTLQKGE